MSGDDARRQPEPACPTRLDPDALPLGRRHRVPVHGRELNVWEAGDPSAPPVLLIHGIPTNHTLWWDVVPRLAPQARVLAVDMLGYGRSDQPDGMPVDIAAQTRYLVALLDALDVRRATVVGHDLGGGVAQILAVRYPERLERLAIMNGVCYDVWPVPLVKPLQLSAPVLEHLPGHPTVDGLRLMLRSLFAHRASAERFLDAFLEPFADDQGLDVLATHLRALDSRHTEELVPALPTLRVPAAVVWGLQDHQLKPETGERLARDIPHAEATWVEDASHFVPCDRPDVVADAVLRLLARGVPG